MSTTLPKPIKLVSQLMAMTTSLVMSESVMLLLGSPVATLRIFLKKSSPAESMRCGAEHLIGQRWGVECIPHTP